MERAPHRVHQGHDLDAGEQQIDQHFLAEKPTQPAAAQNPRHVGQGQVCPGAQASLRSHGDRGAQRNRSRHRQSDEQGPRQEGHESSRNGLGQAIGRGPHQIHQSIAQRRPQRGQRSQPSQQRGPHGHVAADGNVTLFPGLLEPPVAGLFGLVFSLGVGHSASLSMAG